MNFIQRKKNQQPDAANLPDENPETAPQQKSQEKPAVEPVEEKTLYKFGIAQRIDDAVEARRRVELKRSPDLVELSKKFDAMRKGVRQTIGSARAYQQSLEAMDKARVQFAKEFSTFTPGSPIEKNVNNTDQKKSFLSVYLRASEESQVYHEKFQTRILDYCNEWESVISARVDADTDKVKKLRSSYNHYQGKVDALRKKVNSQEAKGQPVNEATAEKLKRNEEKLDEASAAYEAAAGPLCLLIEEVVDQGWKDVFPMIKATMHWELQRSQSEAEAFGMWQARNLDSIAPELEKYEPPSSPVKATKKKAKGKSSSKVPDIPSLNVE